jgi:hypothetical protein
MDPVLIFLVWWLSRAMLLAVFFDSRHTALFFVIPAVVTVLIPVLWGVSRGVRVGSVEFGHVLLATAAIAALTVAMQVEDSRASLAFSMWGRGETLDGSLVWTPRLLPFAAIVWQFGLLFAAGNCRRWGFFKQ